LRKIKLMERKKIALILFLLCSAQWMFAQHARDVFNPNYPVTWLGLDFSQSRFIGDHAKFKSAFNAQNLFDALNDLMLSEKEKFDVGKMLGKQKIIFKLNVTEEHNVRLDVASLLADSLGTHNHLKPGDIEAIVQSYDFEGNTGIGLMFNIESFNKTISEALIWVTFVNMDTKEILFAEKLGQEPGGFGLRNYWAGAIYDMMKRVRKTEFKKWQLKYGNK